MHTGRKILNLRLDRGLTQKQLARRCGITPGALSKIETGTNRPSREILLKLAEALDADPEYLLDEAAPYPPPPHEDRPGGRSKPRQIINARITVEELRLLESLRRLGAYWRDAALAIPKASPETIRIVRFLLKRDKTQGAFPEDPSLRAPPESWGSEEENYERKPST